ncbi:MAG: SDR family oxidoreductase [Halomonas sp.]|nr:SDR family oxidoreductase [Halomonas sp.]
MQGGRAGPEPSTGGGARPSGRSGQRRSARSGQRRDAGRRVGIGGAGGGARAAGPPPAAPPPPPPLGRVACADEVARAVAFLASAENTFISGDTLVVDGGANVAM